MVILVVTQCQKYGVLIDYLQTRDKSVSVNVIWRKQDVDKSVGDWSAFSECTYFLFNGKSTFVGYLMPNPS